MAAIESTRHPLSATGVLGHIVSIIGSTITNIKKWYKVRSTRKVLSNLSDRELDDIGLQRSDIDRIANNHWSR
ncbi:MAG: DUF1127 domain-containing protein [Aestuariivita sp.]|nr:DUF1127 domain-containing protein [Aestuariivita sp.]